MGRYRHHSAEEDSTQRSKRKRTALNGDNLETASAALGTSEGKRALYHCNYCNKDISGKIRIKCVKCPDFDLCVECFSVGAEVTPHKSNHPYRVMDNLSFPLICPDWNADEEILLLEGIEMYGLGNWAEIAEHVGTKNKAHCIDHYTTVYMNSPCFPLPDMSHVVGKNRKELLAMAKGHGEGKKGFPTLGDVTLKEEFPFSPPGVKIEEAALGRSPSSLTSDVNSGLGYSSSNSKSAGAVKKASNMTQIKDDPNAIKMEDSHLDRSIKGNRPKSSGDEEHSMAELSGYNCKRQEFDPEYDNDAEHSLAEMEFKDTDTEAERELKLRVLRIYLKRLDERKRRKDFILERNLLYPDPLMKELSREEREIYLRYRVYMRFHSKEEHKELLRTVIEEYRIRKKIQALQEARAAGCRTSAEAEIYLEQKRKKEIDEISHKDKESAQASGKGLQRLNNSIKGELDGSPHGGVKGTAALESSGKENSKTTAVLFASSLDDWDVTGLPGSDLLSETEQHLCCEARLLPVQYLKMQEVMSIEIFNGNITKKPDAHRFFGVDPRKVDKIFDMLQGKGITLL